MTTMMMSYKQLYIALQNLKNVYTSLGTFLNTTTTTADGTKVDDLLKLKQINENSSANDKSPEYKDYRIQVAIAGLLIMLHKCTGNNLEMLNNVLNEHMSKESELTPTEMRATYSKIIENDSALRAFIIQCYLARVDILIDKMDSNYEDFFTVDNIHAINRSKYNKEPLPKLSSASIQYFKNFAEKGGRFTDIFKIIWTEGAPSTNKDVLSTIWKSTRVSEPSKAPSSESWFNDFILSADNDLKSMAASIREYGVNIINYGANIINYGASVGTGIRNLGTGIGKLGADIYTSMPSVFNFANPSTTSTTSIDLQTPSHIRDVHGFTTSTVEKIKPFIEEIPSLREQLMKEGNNKITDDITSVDVAALHKRDLNNTGGYSKKNRKSKNLRKSKKSKKSKKTKQRRNKK